MQKEYSAGGFVVDPKNKKLLLIKVYHNKKMEISIPKGHIEKNENALITARREIFEETGYRHLKLIRKLPTDKYQYISKNDQKIDKIVYQFLFELINNKQQKQNLDKYEDIKPFWIDLNNAAKIVSFDNIKKIIKQINHQYTNYNKSY